jgi:hypothetical protein
MLIDPDGRPRLVMRSATAPFSSSRRQIGSAPRAGISSIKPWGRSLPTTLGEAPTHQHCPALGAPMSPAWMHGSPVSRLDIAKIRRKPQSCAKAIMS